MTAQRPTCAEIDLNALEHNFALIRRRCGGRRKVLTVVKADAYGHGAEAVACRLEAAGADLFGVALVEEGLELRDCGIDRPILVLGGAYPGQEQAVIEGRLTPCLSDLEGARRLDKAAREAGTVVGYHLKVDTGMGRLGFLPEELPAPLRELARLEGVMMEGVASHLALADEVEHPFTDEQVQRFRDVLGLVRSAGFAPAEVHIANSAATFALDLPECTLVRPGIALYGGYPAEHLVGRIDLRPVMSLRSRVAQVKELPAGAGVSYGHRFVAPRPTRVAAVPIGYGDGYRRRLSGKAQVLIGGVRANVAGTVCMDWILVDVTDLPHVRVGDPVTLLGRDGDACIRAEELAAHCDTISYEIFCGVGKRVPRRYLD